MALVLCAGIVKFLIYLISYTKINFKSGQCLKKSIKFIRSAEVADDGGSARAGGGAADGHRRNAAATGEDDGGRVREVLSPRQRGMGCGDEHGL